MVNKYLYARAGAETYMLYVAEQLIKRGHTVAFFGMEHPENTTLGETRTLPFLEFGSRGSISQKLISIGRALISTASGSPRRSLMSFADSFKPDVIHAHNVYNQLPPSLFKGLRGKIPVVMTAHDYKPVCPNYSLFVNNTVCEKCLDGNYFYCISHRCCHNNILTSAVAALSSTAHRLRGTYRKDYDQFIAPSPFMRDKLVQGGLPEDKIVVIENFSELPNTITKPKQGILFCGRLCVEKGVYILLKAYALLKSPRPELTIAGEGPLEKELKGWSKSNAINDSIRWLGRITPNKVLHELEECAVTVVPSIWNENCSMAIMESLAYGRPVITTELGGNPNLIENGVTGEVFDSSSPSALAGKLEKLLTKRSVLDRESKAARESAEERFSAEVHMEQLLAVYTRLIGDCNE